MDFSECHSSYLPRSRHRSYCWRLHHPVFRNKVGFYHHSQSILFFSLPIIGAIEFTMISTSHMWCSIRYWYSLLTQNICSRNSSKTSCKVRRSWKGYINSTCHSQKARKALLPLDQSLTSYRLTLWKLNLFYIKSIHGLVSHESCFFFPIDADIL